MRASWDRRESAGWRGNNLLPRFISHPWRAAVNSGRARARERHLSWFGKCETRQRLFNIIFHKVFPEMRTPPPRPTWMAKITIFHRARSPEIFIKREKEHEKRARPLGESEKAHKENQSRDSLFPVRRRFNFSRIPINFFAGKKKNSSGNMYIECCSRISKTPPCACCRAGKKFEELQ